MPSERTPPPGTNADREADGMQCPYCGSRETNLERKRGPGLCRRVHYCTACKQPFEEFG